MKYRPQKVVRKDVFSIEETKFIKKVIKFWLTKAINFGFEKDVNFGKKGKRKSLK